MKPVQVYEHETQTIIERFLAHRLTTPECIAALNAALARLSPKLSDGHLASARALMLANNEAMMREMWRRGATKSSGAQI